MKKAKLLIFFSLLTAGVFGQIIADHTVVDRYADIPQYYIDEVKKMLVNVGGESHSLGYQNGVNLLELLDQRFQAVTYTTNPPPTETDQYLRLGRPYMYGEGIWTSQSGIDALNETLLDQHNTGNPFDVFGFGWCWDMSWVNLPGGTEDPVFGVRWAGSTEGGPNGNRRWGLDAGDQVLTGNSVNMDTYLDAIEQYNAYCTSNGMPTIAIFTTGPVDSYYEENAVQRELKHDYIRDYVMSHPGTILFDYADILCWNNSGEKYTEDWDDGGVIRSYAQIHPDNMREYDSSWNIIAPNDQDGDHIGEVGALRIAKAMWWLLARICGWDGEPLTTGTWIGGAAGSETDWFTATNWHSGTVPSAATDVRITTMGTYHPVITGETTAVCRDLTINEAAMMEISAGAQLTVNGSLLNNGSLAVKSSGVTPSGSVVVYGSSSGTGTTSYDRGMPPALYRYISSPVSSATLPADEQFWFWDEPTGQWIETSSCEIGRGYTMLTDGGTVSFTGSVVTSAEQSGTAPYDSEEQHYNNERGEWGGGGWNLLGNPFTSAMDVQLFLAENAADFDPSYLAIYVYNGSDFYYIAAEVPGYEGLGSFPTRDIQAGQGFFVLANYKGVTFNFTPDMQTHNNSAPMTKSARTENTPWPGISLTLKQGDVEKSTQVVYHDGMTAGLDPGYDVGLLSTGTDNSIYTSLVNEVSSVNFTRQALPLSGADTIMIPLGIDTEYGGEVTFSALTVPAGNSRYWLYDRVAGVFTDLTANSYTVTLPAETYGTGRFYLKSAENITAINTPDDAGIRIRIWASERRVIIKGSVGEGATCEVFDLLGSKVTDSILQDTELNTVPVPVGPGGVFLVRITDGERVYTGKVVIL
jgi:hypothetical protein